MNRKLLLAFVCAAAPARAGSFHVGLANAVANEGAKIVNKAANLLPSCGGNFTLFNQFPVTDPSLASIEPLGHLFPPGHTFPSDHLYFHFNESFAAAQSVNLYAPSDGWIIQVVRADYTSGAPMGLSADYQVTFSPCQEVALTVGHVDFIPSFMANPAGPTSTQCSSFSEGGAPGAEAGTSCQINMQVPVKAGQIIGTGTIGDFGPLIDTRVSLSGFVDPSLQNLNRGFCPLNYFSAPVQTAYTALLGQNAGAVLTRRTIPPLCGTVVQDAAGTAQGDWFAPGATDANGLNNIALLHDNVFPSTAAFSIGQSMPAAFQGVNYVYPKTVADGTRINYDFNLVNDNQIYCYDTFEAFPQISSGLNPNMVGRIVLIRMTPSLTNLSIEVQNPGTNCATVGAASWAFTGAAVLFQR
jgi:hypothetical protein